MCQKGKFNEVEGKTKATDCLDCETGKYNDEEGKELCKDCESGKYNDISGQSDGNEACKTCEVGKRSADGAPICLANCIAGTFPSAISNIKCIRCPVGRAGGQLKQSSAFVFSSCGLYFPLPHLVQDFDSKLEEN